MINMHHVLTVLRPKQLLAVVKRLISFPFPETYFGSALIILNKKC